MRCSWVPCQEMDDVCCVSPGEDETHFLLFGKEWLKLCLVTWTRSLVGLIESCLTLSDLVTYLCDSWHFPLPGEGSFFRLLSAMFLVFLAEDVHCCCCRLGWFSGQFLTPLFSSGCLVSNCSISHFTFQPALFQRNAGIPSPTVKHCLHLPKAKIVPFCWLFWVYCHSRENS